MCFQSQCWGGGDRRPAGQPTFSSSSRPVGDLVSNSNNNNPIETTTGGWIAPEVVFWHVSAYTTPTRDTNTNTHSDFQTVTFCREDVGAGAPMGQEVHGSPVVTPSIVTEAALSDIEH